MRAPAILFHIVVLLLLMGCSDSLCAQVEISGAAISDLHTDFIYQEDKKLYQDFYISSGKDAEINLRVTCYKFTSDIDSSLVYRNEYGPQKIKKGTEKIKVPFYGPLVKSFIQPAFANIIKQADIVPPGLYKLQVIVSGKGDGNFFERQFLHEQDSLLAINATIRSGISGLLQPVAKNNFFGGAQANIISSSLDNVTKAFEKNRFRLERYFKKKGLTSRQYQSGDKEVIDLYYGDVFAGRYELDTKASLTNQLKQQQDAFEGNLGSFTKNNLGDYTSLLSQFRELKKNSKENKELTGELAVSANFSNDQEPGSEQDNNFYEARGSLEFPLLDIPVSLSGYYTTQDKNRKAKSSYVHFRYDAEKAKEQLLKLIGSYNKKYEQTLSQGSSYDMIYGQFVGELQSQKESAIASLKQQVSLPNVDISSLNEEQLKAAVERKVMEQKDKLQDSLTGIAQNAGAAKDIHNNIDKAREAKQKAEQAYAKALEQYNKIMELERKIRKYQGMLEQYKNTAYYDSLMAYRKVKDLQNLDETSYKDMAKKASSLLPEGKAKSLITGLTSFDAGMFPKYVSDYTMSGQMLKGLDIGYDIGFAEIGGSYGKTEYIDRDGNVEGYKAYSGRARFKPILHQTIGLVYYGYSPGKKLLSDDGFFKDVSVSMPSFRNPVHIISAVYSGNISKYIHASGEYAMSSKQGQSEEAKAQATLKDKSAYNVKLEGNIPAQNINIEAGYEHAGKAFENNTLPILMAGTDRFRVSGKGDMFRSFLTLGVEYNYLIQNSLASKGNNSKWGFEVATHSKRYPSVSLSYKPFSTFRSFNDTLNIEQKPILGEVWTGKMNYQIKRKDKAIRFTLLYNRNTSTMDTVKYGSALIQFSTIYSRKSTMFSLNLGSSDINTDYIETTYPVFNHSKFINVAASGNVLPGVILSGGTDMATTNAGISRYGFFVGSGYTFKRLPVMLRANFRYSNYRMEELTGWKQLYSGAIELAWRFKVKLFDK
jgi:hypothetical protein